MSQARGLVLGASWALCLLQLLTIVPSAPFVLLEPGSGSQAACVLLFLAGSPGLFVSRLRRLVGLHLLAVGVGLLSHPLTWPFGRDGSIVVMAVHFGLVLAWCTRLRPELRLAAGAGLAALLLAETALSAFREPSLGGRLGMPDYGDVMGPYGPGGFLRPNLDLRVVGPEGRDVAFVTNALGFRQRRPLVLPKPAGLRRVFLVGDSFVAGYRTDQDETLGHALEVELQRRSPEAQVEVMIAGAGHPGAARELAERHLLGMEPDALIVAITLGNDISQAWFEGRRMPATVLDGPLLPADAFPASELALLPVRLDRTLRSFRLYRRLASLLQRDVIQPWFKDHPRHVHLFDPGHSLGHFYARRTLPLVEQSFAALFAEMDALAQAGTARGVTPDFVLLPQRFQVDPAEWDATVFRYGLEAAAFELERPNRRILEHCAAAGLRCLDLLPWLAPACRDAACFQPLGDMHWNARGQARGAKVLAERLSFAPASGP